MSNWSVSPRVSVVIPTYNRASLLLDAIQSVVSQSFHDYEIIVVDDGSTDDTRELVVGLFDSRIRYIYQENRGLSAARNAGIAAAVAEYIALLDSDDVFLPGKLETQVHTLDSDPGLGLVAGGWEVIDAAGRGFEEAYPWLGSPNLDLETWLFRCPVIPSSVVARRTWFQRVGGFDEALRQAEDYDCWLRMAYAGCRMDWTREVVCQYRVDIGSLSHNGRQAQALTQVLEKFFSDTTLPQELLALQPKVCAAGSVRGARHLLEAGLVAETMCHIDTAVRADPDWLSMEGQPLFELIVAWAVFPTIPDAFGYISTVFDHLPTSASVLRRRKREALAAVAMANLLNGYRQQNLSRVCRSFARALVYNPRWIGNRGVCSIAAQSFLGHGLVRPGRFIARKLLPSNA